MANARCSAFLFTFSINHGSVSLGFCDVDDEIVSASGTFWPFLLVMQPH